MSICTINLCSVRDIGVPSLVETDMILGVSVPGVGVLGLLLTEPTLNCGTVTLPAEQMPFFGKDLSL